ncbi:MAG: hypothetical protein V4682_00730 [Patescibacteria group bacterium]
MTHTPLKTLSIFAVMALAFVPFGASAASSKVSCELTVETSFGEVSFDGSEEVLVQKDDEVTISWEGKNATKVVDGDKDEVDLEDSITVTPDEDETFSYTFTDRTKKATCSVDLVVIDSSIDEDTLATDSAKPTISGEATGAKSVRLEIADEKGKTVFKSKTIRTKRGDWSVRVTKTLKDGSYDVTLFGDKGAEINIIATGTLVVGEGSSTGNSASKKGGQLSVSALPLLSGGNAATGASVPVAYIKVSNPSNETAYIDGFTLKQNGSASTDSVVSFLTNDDKSGSRYTTAGTNLFKNGSAFVGLPATVAPGQVRIFTIKANLAANSNAYAGQTLMLDVASITSGAKLGGTFPIRGTTWTLTY